MIKGPLWPATARDVYHLHSMQVRKDCVFYCTGYANELLEEAHEVSFSTRKESTTFLGALRQWRCHRIDIQNGEQKD